MTSKNIYLILKCLSVVGIILALFLLWEQFFHPSFQPCNINSTINCDAIINGPVARTLGIPTPVFGLVGYMIIFYAAAAKNKKLLLFMASFGILFCLYIAYIELILLKVICPVCLLCDLDMLSVFILSVWINRHKSSSN